MTETVPTFELKGEEKRCGAGGTKSVYELPDGENVVYIPNRVDGPWLVGRWPTIMGDEMFLQQKCREIGIPCLDFKPCKLSTPDNYIATSEPGICDTCYSKSFHHYTKEGVYIVDSKCGFHSSTWHKEFPKSHFWGQYDDIENVFASHPEINDAALWAPLFKPLVADFKLLAQHGLSFGSDAINVAFVKKGHKWHDGSDLPYVVRLFLFDLTSKHTPDERTFTKKPASLYHRLLSHAVEHALWEQLCPLSMFMPQPSSKLVKSIFESIVPELV
jgi:hypothetical protein